MVSHKAITNKKYTKKNMKTNYLEIIKIKINALIYSNANLYWKISSLKRLFGLSIPPAFFGWGMTTQSTPPWVREKNYLDKEFSKAHKELIKKVRLKSIVLSQFEKKNDVTTYLHQLLWRHYIVFWSSFYAAKTSILKKPILVECGVCDGLTAFFASKAQGNNKNWKFYLYDAWQGMKSKPLLKAEKKMAGDYNYLSFENTKINLIQFKKHLIFRRGFIPQSFAKINDPEKLSWLHIDLNSAKTTQDALKYFFPKIARGGLILFDDYAFYGYTNTRTSVDKFFQNKKGLLLPLPTGQAIFFKS